jgi:hypothetical protein
MPFLDGSARELIDAYNRDPAGRRYNQIAEGVYEARRTFADALSPQFECHILDGLVGFGIGITIKGGRAALKPRLQSCLDAVRKTTAFDQLRDCRLTTADLVAIRPVITSAYDHLALPGTLHPLNQSHVAATKTLNWLFPDLFLIVDSNVAKTFREHFGVRFWRSTQPGYCSDKYFSCLWEAQKAIHSFGSDRFRQLESETPEARIFDKIAFIVGRSKQNKKPQKRLPVASAPVPTTTDDIPGSAATFWQTIYDLRKRNLIPKQWSKEDIRPHLRDRFKKNTINTVPANESVSRDGSIKGDYVKRGRAAKAYRVDRGLFEL